MHMHIHTLYIYTRLYPGSFLSLRTEMPFSKNCKPGVKVNHQIHGNRTNNLFGF